MNGAWMNEWMNKWAKIELKGEKTEKNKQNWFQSNVYHASDLTTASGVLFVKIDILMENTP